MPQFRYLGAHEYLHVGPPARVLNYGETVSAPSNPDPSLFEPVPGNGGDQ